MKAKLRKNRQPKKRLTLTLQLAIFRTLRTKVSRQIRAIEREILRDESKSIKKAA